jgi:hypothetical protein
MAGNPNVAVRRDAGSPGEATWLNTRFLPTVESAGLAGIPSGLLVFCDVVILFVPRLSAVAARRCGGLREFLAELGDKLTNFLAR